MIVLDHLAIGTSALADGWELFSGLLGGRWAYGGDSAGFWWGQLQFSAGPKIELITPTSGPDAAFLDRFLSSRGPGPHHLNFIVPDIEVTLSRVKSLGIEPVQVRLVNSRWKEAFIHPRDAHGIVIQVAEQSGPPPLRARPSELPQPGAPSAFAVIEHHVADIVGATRLFQEALDGEVVSQVETTSHSAVELAWPNDAKLRLVRSAPGAEGRGARSGGVIGRLHFTRDGSALHAADLERLDAVSRGLGVSVLVTG